MSNILTIGFGREGSTDERFLEHIIQRTFEDIAFECEGEIEVYQVVAFEYPNASTFNEKVLLLAQIAENQGLMVLCIHTDADSLTDDNAFEYRINPAFELVESSNGDICKNLVAVVPIQETEAWMIADKQLLKNEIGTSLTNTELGLHRQPQSIARPKEFIENLLHQDAEATQTKKYYQVKISELYTPIGQKVDLNFLRKLSSYQKFEESVRTAYRKLNYLL